MTEATADSGNIPLRTFPAQLVGYLTTAGQPQMEGLLAALGDFEVRQLAGWSPVCEEFK